MAVIAIGLNANQLFMKEVSGLTLNKYGDIVVSPESMETTVNNVYAGGDIVCGEGTVIKAMGMAKRVAEAIIKRLSPKQKS